MKRRIKVAKHISDSCPVGTILVEQGDFFVKKGEDKSDGPPPNYYHHSVVDIHLQSGFFVIPPLNKLIAWESFSLS